MIMHRPTDVRDRRQLLRSLISFLIAERTDGRDICSRRQISRVLPAATGELGFPSCFRRASVGGNPESGGSAQLGSSGGN